MIVPVDRKTAEAYHNLCHRYRDIAVDDGNFFNLTRAYESYSDFPTIVALFTQNEPDDVQEFNFAVYRIPEDKYWHITDFSVEQMKETFWINGAFINHGTTDQPNWSSHT